MSKYTDPHDLAWQLANRVTDLLGRADSMRDALSLLVDFLGKEGHTEAVKSWIQNFVKPEIERYDTVRAKGVRE